MITPDQIKEKAQRLYPQYVEDWLGGKSFFPRHVPTNLKLPDDLAEAKRSVELLRSGSKQARGYGYFVQWELRKSRKHGLNEFPTAISFESESDFLKTINRTQEFAKLSAAVSKLRLEQPRLGSWLLESTHWKDLLKVAGHLDQLLLMIKYFQDHPRPDCFAREIPLPVSTKLIEENREILAQWLDRLLPEDQIDAHFDRAEFEPRYGLRYARPHLLLRCLDHDLQQKLKLRFDELSLPLASINRLPVTNATLFVVENKVNLLTLPPVKNGIAMGGLGKAVSLLESISWLKDCQVYYWGDLDVEGFEILSQFRERFENTQSMLMDLQTLKSLKDLAIEWKNKPGAKPPALTDEEEATYDYLLSQKIRLEQERISQAMVTEWLRTTISQVD